MKLTLTPGRLAWMQKLEREGIADRPRGPIGLQCMRAGYTEWTYAALEDGRTMTRSEAIERFGREYWDHVKIVGEQLTDEGRAALKDRP